MVTVTVKALYKFERYLYNRRNRKKKDGRAKLNGGNRNDATHAQHRPADSHILNSRPGIFMASTDIFCAF